MRLNGLDFHVEIEGEGPPRVLLHGFTGSVRTWDDIRPHLARGSRVIALDLIGHGQSASPPDPGRYSLAWCTRDLVALLDQLRLESVDLLGYSMGGRAALHFAVHAPGRVRRLVLESASPGIEDDAERERRVQSDEALAQRILQRGIAEFVAEWEQQPLLQLAPHVPAEERARQHQLRLSNHPLGLANSLRGMGAGRQQPLWSRLPGLASLPALLIVGAADQRYRGIAERMHAVLARSQLEVVPEAGHTVHLDQPATFARLVKN